MSADQRTIVIGAGIVGCTLALRLKAHGRDVLIIDSASDLLTRASFANQARVHTGYHYPRSLLTGMRSRANFDLFVDEFRDCLDTDFEQYYAIGRRFSKVTTGQFKLFCKRIDAFLQPAPKHVAQMFSSQWVDGVFLAKEYAFNALKLRARLRSDLLQAGVELRLNCTAARVERVGGDLKLTCQVEGSTQDFGAGEIFNCTYSGLNRILDASGLPIIPLKHELTEMALVEAPSPLAHVGITVMDGPFFSFMPFPARGLHSLSHVRYTPHVSWRDEESEPYVDGESCRGQVRDSRFVHMIKDASRYVPMLADCKYVESLWEIKTVLPRSEVDDSRPILIQREYGMSNLTCILGAKVDNIYDIFDELGFGANAGVQQ